METKGLVELHRESEDLGTSFYHPEGFGLDEYTALCNGCQNPVHEFRGEVVSFDTHLSIRATGACHDCGLVTQYTTRVYADRVVHKTPNGWLEIPVNQSPWKRLKAFLRKVWGGDHA